MNKNLLYSLIEGIYIFYMFNFFKTSVSIHHPLEILLEGNTYLQHPIETGNYENKICKLGNLAGIFLLSWFLFRWKLSDNSRLFWNKRVLYLITILSLLLNLNAFIYYLPIILFEYHMKYV